MQPGRSRIDAIVITVCALAGAGLWAVEIQRAMPRTLLIVDVCAGAVACAVLWWRSDRPVLVAGLMVPITLVSFSSTPALLVSLYVVSERRGGRVAWIIGVCDLAAVVAGTVITPQNDESPLWQTGLTVAVLLAATVAIGLYAGARRQLIATLEERAARAEQEKRHEAERARSAERTRIAQEMHDVVAHRLALISLHSGVLQVDPAAREHESVASAAAFLQATSQSALRELRDAIGVLRDHDTPQEQTAPRAPQPTLTDVASLVEEAQTAGLTIDFRCGLSPADLALIPDRVGRHVHRVVQEGLTNLAKHAPRSAATLTIDGRSRGGVLLTMRNAIDRSVPRADGHGSGLVSLHERVTRAGGTFTGGPDGPEFVLRAEWPEHE